MRRTAATRIVSRVVLPSRVLAVGLGVAGGPSEERRGCAAAPGARGGLGGPFRGACRLRRDASSPPGGLRGPFEKRHGCAGTLRATLGVKGGPSRSVSAPPRRSE